MTKTVKKTHLPNSSGGTKPIRNSVPNSGGGVKSSKNSDSTSGDASKLNENTDPNSRNNSRPIKNSDKYVNVHIDTNKRTKGIVGSPSFLRLQSESEIPPVNERMVTVDTSKCRSNIDVVRKCVKDLGWREFPYGRRDKSCDIYWHAVNFNETPDVQSGRISKFPGTIEIFSKSNLFRCLDVMKGLYPADYEFYPRTWFLPHQFYHFNAVAKSLAEKKVRHKPTYIVKPSDGSQGDGIYLIRDPSQYSHFGHKKHVVQEYLSNVLLIDNFKFDFRVYAILKSINPLEIHICKEGLARFSTIPYEHPNAKNLQETFMHLTNYSLNKRSSTFDKSEKDNEGSKRKLTQVLHTLKKRGYDSEGIWLEIEQIVCKTILAVIGDLKVELQSAVSPGKSGLSCFQILGFDIILLSDLKPMLLEVNSNPSLRIDCEVEVSPGVMDYQLSMKDEEVKRPLICDTLMLIAPHKKYTRKRRRKRKPRPIPVVKPVIINQPTALVIMSDTQDVSERLLKFGFMDNTLYSSSNNNCESDNPNLSNPSTPTNERSSQTLNSASTILTRDKIVDDYSDKTLSNQNKYNNENQSDQNELTNRKSPISESGFYANTIDSEIGGKSAIDNSEQDAIEGEENEDSDQEEEYYDDVEREESCLKEIYPSLYGSEYQHLNLLDKLAKMFMSCIGVRGSTRLSSSAFRLFSRKCKLNGKGISNATIDLVYIDIQRKWKHMCVERGLNFCGFVDACQDLAKRKFASFDRLEMLQNFIDLCEENMQKQELEDEEKKTLLVRRQQSQRAMIYPQFTSSNLGEATLHDLYGQSLRKEYINLQHKKVSAFMMAHHKRNYQHRTRLDLKPKRDDT